MNWYPRAINDNVQNTLSVQQRIYFQPRNGPEGTAIRKTSSNYREREKKITNKFWVGNHPSIRFRILHDDHPEWQRHQWRRRVFASSDRTQHRLDGPWPVQRIQHLNNDERRQRHRRRLIVGEYVAVDAAKPLVLHETLRLVSLHEVKHRQAISVKCTTSAAEHASRVSHNPRTAPRSGCPPRTRELHSTPTSFSTR